MYVPEHFRETDAEAVAGLMRDFPLACIVAMTAEGLVATIYHGRPGTPMPPWKQFMSEAEADWIVQKLMSGFPQ